MSTTLTIGHLSTIYHTSFILMGTDWLDRAGIRAAWKLFASFDHERSLSNLEVSRYAVNTTSGGVSFTF